MDLYHGYQRLPCSCNICCLHGVRPRLLRRADAPDRYCRRVGKHLRLSPILENQSSQSIGFSKASASKSRDVGGALAYSTNALFEHSYLWVEGNLDGGRDTVVHAIFFRPSSYHQRTSDASAWR